MVVDESSTNPLISSLAYFHEFLSHLGYVVLLILASLCFIPHCFGIHAKKKVGKYENMNSSCVLNVVFCLPCVCVSLNTIQRMGSVWRKKV